MQLRQCRRGGSGGSTSLPAMRRSSCNQASRQPHRKRGSLQQQGRGRSGCRRWQPAARFLYE